MRRLMKWSSYLLLVSILLMINPLCIKATTYDAEVGISFSGQRVESENPPKNPSEWHTPTNPDGWKGTQNRQTALGKLPTTGDQFPVFGFIIGMECLAIGTSLLLLQKKREQ
ncbi:hypothetical protein X560_2172 [Listeria fleischmannii 1991]|uniref:Gram-positive cocci surface proteins LPxTG domain-containing protein n=2 Tax=Listeria fleischmannii TaxID=1069827 RepID=A0A2X3J5Z2_9LIST|nr:LPXTG cell wall anchor domain-containing protein [Listeria fleischmannii]EMG26901.1 hypothetical protein LFLEISCH_14067 [Listeria fleischmannii subsp. fleischmannii LU2006-1]KMT58346.1 hypothetical protein X560_2172 [Listeria fleischmannii 1991]SQC68469.1 Uncharacterised protein [Listeria fleischmannii subsp. fleischmannii]